VLPIPTEAELHLRDKDLKWGTCRGSGKGGQARNKLETAVQLTHLPSGISVRCENEKSQHRNRETALEMLKARLLAAEKEKASSTRAANRRAQVGSGMRGDKVRTVRVRDGVVNDHVLGKKWKLKDYLRGLW